MLPGGFVKNHRETIRIPQVDLLPSNEWRECIDNHS